VIRTISQIERGTAVDTVTNGNGIELELAEIPPDLTLQCRRVALKSQNKEAA